MFANSAIVVFGALRVKAKKQCNTIYQGNLDDTKVDLILQWQLVSEHALDLLQNKT